MRAGRVPVCHRRGSAVTSAAAASATVALGRDAEQGGDDHGRQVYRGVHRGNGCGAEGVSRWVSTPVTPSNASASMVCSGLWTAVVGVGLGEVTASENCV